MVQYIYVAVSRHCYLEEVVAISMKQFQIKVRSFFAQCKTCALSGRVVKEGMFCLLPNCAFLSNLAVPFFSLEI